MADNVQLIKDRLDLIGYLRQYLELKPAGKNLKALCPFHREKTPSFMVSPERQIWYCFGGCHEGGDLFKFVMKYENIDFSEALRLLAEKAGLDLRPISAAEREREKTMFEINAAAKDFFKKQSLPLDYLKTRGLKPATIEEFELGASPAATDSLFRHLNKLGFRPEEMERAGVVFKTERGTYWDRFRGRLIFPLYNAFGKVVGFTGRILEGIHPSAGSGQGKYVNSPETPIFSKSKILYGWHKAKEAVRTLRQAVLVEGQMDFLMSWQEGLKNTVATSGTALTPNQLMTLRRSADKIILAFDTDLAGRAATERSIDLAEAADFEIRVARLAAKDPAEVVQEHPGRLAQLVREAPPAMEHYFSVYLDFLSDPAGTDIYRKKQNLRLVLQKIKKVASAIAQAEWLKKLSELTGIEETVLREEMAALKSETAPAKSEPGPVFQKTVFSRHELIAQELLGRTIHLKEALSEHWRAFLPPAYQTVFDYLKDSARNFSLTAEAAALLDLIELKPEKPGDAKDLLRELNKEYFKRRCEEILLNLKAAERSRDEAKTKLLLKEFDQSSKKMHNLIK